MVAQNDRQEPKGGREEASSVIPGPVRANCPGSPGPALIASTVTRDTG